MIGIGITATDTEMGKTVVSGILAAVLSKRGYRTGVYKPVASGCVRNDQGKLISTDAEFLLRCVGMEMDFHDKVVPYVLEAALAPAEAGKLAGISIEPKKMLKAGQKMLQSHDISIIEGVGGISAPLTDNYLVKDFFRQMEIPIIIVVKPILGNVNHAVLTAYYAQQQGLKVLGFLVNGWDEENAGNLERSNLYYYEKLTGLPILGKLPHFDQELLENFAIDKMVELTEKAVDINKIIEMAGGKVK